jgi:outer membrane protein assembly factor BamB
MKDFQVAVTYDQDPPTWKVAGKEGIYDNVSGPAAMWLFFYEAYDVSQPLQYIFWGNDKSSPFDGSILKVVLSTDYVGYTPFSGYDNEKRWYGIRLQDGQGIQDNNQLEYIATRYSVNARWSILKGQLPPTYGILGGPVIGDVDGDGKKDIVVGARDSMIYAFGGSGTGTQDTSIWPSPYKAGGEIQGTPALVDLNGDGKLDVVFGADDMYVYAISGATGLELWKHDTKSSPTDSYLIHGSPSIAQLNGGAYDVLIGTGKGEMFALNGENGSEIWKFPTTGGIAGTPGVADISGDGIPDVCFGSYDTKVHLVNGATGEEIWFYYLGPGMDNIDSSPVMVDISGDNVPDVIIGGRKGTPPETGTVLALDGASPGPTANELWPAPHIYGNARLPLAPAKINDDDVWDFIMTTYQGEVYSIYAINGANGEILYHTLGLDIPPVGVFNYSAPIVGDFTGDGHLNAIYGREDGYCDMVNIGDLDLPGGFAGKCLAKMQVSSGTSMEIYGPPAVEDVNGDGLWELIACSMRGFTYVLDMHAPVPADIHQRGWTQHMGNRWHTGVPEFVPPDE